MKNAAMSISKKRNTTDSDSDSFSKKVYGKRVRASVGTNKNKKVKTDESGFSTKKEEAFKPIRGKKAFTQKNDAPYGKSREKESKGFSEYTETWSDNFSSHPAKSNTGNKPYKKPSTDSYNKTNKPQKSGAGTKTNVRRRNNEDEFLSNFSEFESYNYKKDNDRRSYNKASFKKESFKPKERKGIKQQSTGTEDDLIRLNKFIANAGICSRREADELIKAGAVTVNGKIITEMGYKVKRTDMVSYGGQGLRPEKHVYILLNKPKDYITTSDDPQERKTVMQLIKGACKQRVYPVGRLDRNTTGLLLLTNDGEMTDKITHPSFKQKKIYHVELDKPVKKEHLNMIINGFELEDGFIKADDIDYVEQGSKNEVGITLHSGRNRIVRRIFEHLEYKVKKLDRVYFAGLTKKDLPRGKWRLLTPMEVNMLKMIQ